MDPMERPLHWGRAEREGGGGLQGCRETGIPLTPAPKPLNPEQDAWGPMALATMANPASQDESIQHPMVPGSSESPGLQVSPLSPPHPQLV